MARRDGRRRCRPAGSAPGALGIGAAPARWHPPCRRQGLQARFGQTLGQGQKPGNAAHQPLLSLVLIGAGGGAGTEIAVAPPVRSVAMRAASIRMSNSATTLSRPACPHPARARIGQGDDGLRQARRIARRHDMSRHAVLDQFRNPADLGGDHRLARGHRLHQHDRHAFGERGQHQRIGLAQGVGHGRPGRESPEPDIASPGAAAPPRFWPVRPVAHQRQPQSRHFSRRAVSKASISTRTPLIGTSRPTKTRCRPPVSCRSALP
jgi:hypothetical protein